MDGPSDPGTGKHISVKSHRSYTKCPSTLYGMSAKEPSFSKTHDTMLQWPHNIFNATSDVKDCPTRLDNLIHTVQHILKIFIWRLLLIFKTFDTIFAVTPQDIQHNIRCQGLSNQRSHNAIHTMQHTIFSRFSIKSSFKKSLANYQTWHLQAMWRFLSS